MAPDTSELKIYYHLNGLKPIAVKARLLARRVHRHWTRQKAANYLLNQREKSAGRRVLASRPIFYIVETCNICNLKCPHCVSGRGELKHPRELMSGELWRRIIDQISPYAFLADMFNWGEPMLHPGLWEMVHYAQSQNVGVRISSNLNRLDSQGLDGIFASDLDELMVSMDGPNQEIYATYRRGGNFNQVIENIRAIMQRRTTERRTFPIVTLRFLATAHSEPYLADMFALARDLKVDNLIAAPLKIRYGALEQVQGWLPKNKKYSLYEGEGTDLTATGVKPCPYPWEEMVVSPGGAVSLCCCFDLPEYDCGNAAATPLFEIWNGAPYREARGFLSHGREGALTLCRLCRGHPLALY